MAACLVCIVAVVVAREVLLPPEGAVQAAEPGEHGAQAASPAGLIADHDAEMTTQHDMIQTDISDAQTAIQGDLTTLLQHLGPCQQKMVVYRAPSFHM